MQLQVLHLVHIANGLVAGRSAAQLLDFSDGALPANVLLIRILTSPFYGFFGHPVTGEHPRPSMVRKWYSRVSNHAGSFERIRAPSPASVRHRLPHAQLAC